MNKTKSNKEKDKSKEYILDNVIRTMLSIIIYALGLSICDGTWYKELALVIIILVGYYVQSGGLK